MNASSSAWVGGNRARGLGMGGLGGVAGVGGIGALGEAGRVAARPPLGAAPTGWVPTRVSSSSSFWMSASTACKWLLIRFPTTESAPFIGNGPVLASAPAVPAAIVEVTTAPLRSEIGHSAVGALLMIIGLASIALSRLRVRGSGAALLWFGAFTLLYGMRLIANSGLPLVLGGSLVTARFAVAFITYVIPVPGWQLARALLGDGWKGSLRWQVAAFAAFAPIGILTFGSADTGSPLLVTNSMLNDATAYLLQNFTTPGQSVGFQVDTDRNGFAD